MPRKRIPNFNYSDVTINGHKYFKSYVMNADHKLIIVYTEAPYIAVRKAWHTENNRPVIMTQLKTKAARRDVAIPDQLAECLREARKNSSSEYVVANNDGEPLSYTQFKLLWRYIKVRTAVPRPAKKKVDGKYVKYTLYPQLGEKARNNGNVVYSLDFEVTPHQLRHTYITNLIAAGVDPKTVQYLAGHENSKITISRGSECDFSAVRSQGSSSRSAVLQEIIIRKDFSRGTQKRIFQTFPRRQSIRSYASPAGFCFKTSITPAPQKTERG